MAAISFFGMRGLQFLCRSSVKKGLIPARCLSSAAPSSAPAAQSAEDDEKQEPARSWLQKMMGTGGNMIDASKQSHSRMLSDKDVVYELQVHKVKPEFMEQYLKEYHQFVNTVHAKGTGAELAGSWTVEIGDQDEAIHLWRYGGGYPALNHATKAYRTDKEFVDFRVSRNRMLRGRNNQILLAFSFWGDIKSREGSNIYELRSYTLKPGTMIEWGNNWAQGLKYRSSSSPVGGFFSQIGQLYTVHHIWAYESLQSRKEVRENAWKRPGWDECVRYTVPLIRHMTARILIPTPFSPMK